MRRNPSLNSDYTCVLAILPHIYMEFKSILAYIVYRIYIYIYKYKYKEDTEKDVAVLELRSEAAELVGTR